VLLRSGVGAGELIETCKRTYVRIAANQAKQEHRRVSQSRIAIASGLTRAEVKRLLTSELPGRVRYEWQLDRATRVLQGWKTDPQFRTSRGSPKSLPIRGRGSSFSLLVRRYSGDVPVRAMLDHLRESKIVAFTAGGEVRLARGSRVNRNSELRELAQFTKAGTAYLRILAHNALSKESARYARSTKSRCVLEKDVPVLRRMLISRADSFLDSAEEVLSSRRAKASRSSSRRIGVSVFVSEE
jgi:hypothetical protein